MTTEIVYLPIEKISPNPYQPRRYFERRALLELCESIKMYGVLEPITVRLINGVRYELVTGERRLRASKMAGFRTIPAVISEMSDKTSALAAMIENLQRQNLNYLDEAQGYRTLMNDYSITKDELARKLGKPRELIAQKLRLLQFSEAVRSSLAEKNIPEEQAMALLAVETEREQLDAINRISYKNFQSRERLKRRVRKVKFIISDVRIFTNTIREAVNVMNRSGIRTEFSVTEGENGYSMSINIFNKRH
ncbi:nucleoid occlusion protein [Clostridia bacterium]|nr:nucleoid occlusion protein [Clostridia bacterium]